MASTASVIKGTDLPPISTLKSTWLSTDMLNKITRFLLNFKINGSLYRIEKTVKEKYMNGEKEEGV